MTDYDFGKWLSTPPLGEEVVVTGLSGRLPESNNIYEFREHLFNKEDMVTDDDRRWLLDHKEIPQRNGKIYNIDKLDAGFFGVHNRQVNIMDPMMRKFLETAVEAVIDAGMNPSELEGSNTGVFVGACYADMEIETLNNITEPQKMGITGYLRSFIAHRLSYYLKLKGPSYIADTACSSSLNALEHAFKAIRSGQCDNAIVGGVNLLLHPGITLQFFRLGVLSYDGICKVFDQNANGYVRGDTIACIFLQKSKVAKRIYAQILHTKINCDGFKSLGITFPSTQMQQQLMTEIFDESVYSPSDLSYLEAHGTGTEVGDPQEVEAVDEAIAKKREKPLLIGSVKCSIGHTEPASGLCSLIKVIIAMETGLIAPNIYLNKIKTGMEGFEQGRLKAVTELTELEGDEAVVGINNFGFGGNNCHLLIKRFKKEKIKEGLPDDDAPRLVCVSGRTEESILSLLNDLKNKPFDAEYVRLFHDIFKKNHKNFLYRGYTILSKNGPLKTSFKFYIDQPQSLYICFGQFDTNFRLLGNHLLYYPPFKATISRINTLLSHKNINIIDIILDKQRDIENELLGGIAVQIGIVDILKTLEVNPAAVYGDGLGKLTTAYYYETITLEEAMLAAYKAAQTVETITGFVKMTSTEKNDYIRDDCSTYENVIFPKNSIILNISDKCLNANEIMLVENNTVTFLEFLGRIYEQGHDLHLHKIYPEVQFPVSRGTPMISPLIKWNYKRTWCTYKFEGFTVTDAEHREFNFSLQYDEHKYIQGHIIDGRNLFPATAYLTIVWETYVQSRRLAIMDVPLVFENCKFIRAVTMPKSGFIHLTVMIHQGTGNFEVLQKNVVVVTGRIYSPEDVKAHKSNFTVSNLEEHDPSLVLEQDEIYRELYLRGYNYSGLFKGLAKCNVDATAGLIKWEGNWTTFMDKMLQMRILQMDTRSLYVPTGIQKLVIDPWELLNLVGDSSECLISSNVCKDSNIVKAPGIEICGIQANSILRRKSLFEPVLEKYEFIPNETLLDLTKSIRINIQIILENSLENNFKSVEILHSADMKFLSPLIREVLEDVPLVNPDLTISTKTTVENMPGVKVEDFPLTSESNLLLIIGTKILQRFNLKPILIALSRNGFVLTREDIDFVVQEYEDIEIVTQHVTEDEKLILFRKSKYSNTKCIEVSSNHFDWLPELRNSLKQESNVVVYSQNQELDGIIGLVNCMRREPGGGKVKCFFIVDDAPKFDPKNPFYHDQIKKDLAVNVYKNCKWGTYRHLLLEELKEVECEHCYVNTTSKGDLSSLRWIEGPLTPQTPMKKGSVLIYSYYSSVNFKDIMLASGRINSDVFSTDRIEQECLLGFEFSGRDLSGRRVIGMVSNAAISTLIVGSEDFLWTIPDSWSLEDAATVPVVYCTVIYALLSVTTIKPGISILIHSATGGIGIAALNVCLHHGCEVFVTVGTQEKRDYLKKHYPDIPESHIGNSHDTSFEEMIKIQTNGRGVDIVLNSLTEEKLKASIRCLARGGKLLEIGKYDLANNSFLNLLLLEKETSYHGVMLDRIFLQSTKVKKWLLNKLYEGMESGFVKPLPKTIFKRHEIETAFRYMTTGKHIGKVLIAVRDEEEEKTAKPIRGCFKAIPRFNCDPVKSYIILGGLGGFGMELADWLMLRGARKLVLVSSSGIRSGYQTQRLRILESYGVDVHISKADITARDGCIALIKDAAKLGPIDGIFNLAVVLKDALFEDQTEDNFRISLAPKANATLHLDQITRELCPNLRYFVIFSSVSCGRGNAGQTNYGMANSVMERICEKRKRDGFPALAIQWGAIGEVGLVAKMQKENKELVIGGTLQQKVSSCLEVLDKFLKQENSIVASMVVAEKHNRGYDTGSAVDAIAFVLGIKDMKTVNLNATLPELGMDSIMGTEVLQLLEKDFEIYVTAKDVRNLTFAKLIELEAEKKNSEEKNVKTENNVNLFLKYIPEGEADYSPITKLPSLVDDAENAYTVFVFPGVEGTLIPLESFLSNLNAHVYGVRYSFYNPEDSIEETAKTVLPDLEKYLSKDQTFHLIGYSYGTVVAIEMASLLESKGYCGNVIAIDGAPAYVSFAANCYLKSEIEGDLQSIILYKLLEMLLPINVILDNKDKFLKCDTFEERIDVASSLLPQNISGIKQLNKQGAIVTYKRFKSVLDYNFVHNKLRSAAYLFMAQFPMVTNVESDYKLSEYFEQPVKVTVVEGDHATILNQSKLIEDVNKLLHPIKK